MEVTVGHDATYTIDVPNLPGFNLDLIALYENDQSEFADDDSKLQPYVNGSDGWTVTVEGNKLRVTLVENPALVQRELKVFIYYNKAHISDAPDSLDVNNVAFILTIRPVLFKVTGFILSGYFDDEIHVDNINTFASALNNVNSPIKFTPVYEYAENLLDVVLDSNNNQTLQDVLDQFSSEFLRSQYVSKTRARGENANTYYFQVTTAVAYRPYQGVAYLTDEPAYRLWQTFKVIADNAVNSVSRDEYQAVGTQKKYYLDNSLLPNDLDEMIITCTDTDATVNWNKDHPNYLIVELPTTASVDSTVDVMINNQVTLQIHPVFYEVLGFEPVEHPERGVWVIDPYTTDDLQYRVITTDLSNTPVENLAAVQANIANLNNSLNNGVAPKEISIVDNQFIIFDAAVNYDAGYPDLVAFAQDKRNIVESIIPYRIWSSLRKPNPEYPSPVGKTQTKQVVGKTKLYTLKNIKGQVFYQYLWGENVGNLLASFENSSDGTTKVYEGLSILADTNKNTLQIQLTANAALLENTIRIYVPYLTTVNGREVWYSYCIEITPLLFELKGWTIKGVGETGLINDPNYEDYLLLTTESDPNTLIKYVARINQCDTEDAELNRLIDDAKAEIESNAVNYIMFDNPDNFIGLDGYYVKRNYAADVESDTLVGLSTYVVYENGVPNLVTSSNTLVANQILISTGYDIGTWQDKVGKMLLGSGVDYAVQALGTSAVYIVDIPNAVRIFYDQIKIVEKDTDQPVMIPGERASLISIDLEDTDNHQQVNFTLNLAPVVALREHIIEIRIPYSDDENADQPNYVYQYYVTPAVFIVEGFYLKSAEDNNLALANNDVILELCAQVSYSDDVNVRNIAKLMIQNLETAVNNAISNQTLKFSVAGDQSEVNVSLGQHGNRILIHKDDDLTALNYITGRIKIGYSNGIPQWGGVNPLTDIDIDLKIQVTTRQGETSYFPGWGNVIKGKGSEFKQAIGTSNDYTLKDEDTNTVFYYKGNGNLDNIRVVDDKMQSWPKSGVDSYEHFAYQVTGHGYQSFTISITLKTSVRDLTNYIDIQIPYTTNVDGKQVWFYYSLRIAPILFEIKAWKLKIDDELYDSVTLDDSAVELYFSPEIKSAPLTDEYYTEEDLAYVKRSRQNLEMEINTYDPKISDGYTYLALNNTAQEGYRVNYTVERDDDAKISYLVRSVTETSTTILQASANIVYGVTDLKKEYVEGAQAVAAYSNTSGAHRITSNIAINTTEKSAYNVIDDRPTVFISQENASRLMSLNSGVDYVLMSDIYLYKIPGLNNGQWKPVNFPNNATLDGNNFRVFFNSTGFDLSDKPTNIGMFTSIPAGSVVKNLQIVLERGITKTQVTILTVDLRDYAEASVNIGLVAGINEGIVTNCAVLSGWQFSMRDLTDIINPVTNEKFSETLLLIVPS